MGEVADDMINGRCCQWCNEYFEKEHGYPVVCKACGASDDHDKDNPEHPQIAIYETLT